MRIEVLFMSPAKVAGHRHPDVVSYDDGPLVRALLQSGIAVLIDPPHLEGYNDHEVPKEPSKSVARRLRIMKQEENKETTSEDVY